MPRCLCLIELDEIVCRWFREPPALLSSPLSRPPRAFDMPCALLPMFPQSLPPAEQWVQLSLASPAQETSE